MLSGLKFIVTFFMLSFLIVQTCTEKENVPTYDKDDFDQPHSNRFIFHRSTSPHVRSKSVATEDGGRRKRAVFDKPNKWDLDIPVVFDSSYLEYGEKQVDTVKLMMERISGRVCLTFHDVTNRWDPDNPTWFTQNGFESDVYLLIKGGDSCAAGSRPAKSGAQIVTPCLYTGIITHELLHILGVPHTQQVASRDNFITINNDNINPDLRRTYAVKEPTEKLPILDTFFDAQSVVLYGPTTWTVNGLETYTLIRDDIVNTQEPVPRRDAAVFYELSQVYKCKERFCANDHTDCGEGYLTYIRGGCRCVCPSELDPENNCQTLIDKASPNVSWPPVPLAVLSGEPDYSCPTGFDPQVSWLNFTREGSYQQSVIPVPIPFSAKTVSLPICTRPVPSGVQEDWEAWPQGGNGCFIKLKGKNCGTNFEEFVEEFTSSTPVQQSGSLVDVNVNGSTVILKFCCRAPDMWGDALVLPNREPFRLLTRLWHCPPITGLRVIWGWDDDVFGKTSRTKLKQCYYLPPVYGCNRVIKLDANTRSVTVTTPGFGTAREPNRRCLYSFQVPKNARTRITFNIYDVHGWDWLFVKRYHKLQQEYRIDNSDWPYQIVSNHEYLTLEYWSFWEPSTSQGLNFTADVILPEESCYDVTLRGEDYAGDTSITETYEKCLPWGQTVGCIDFPTDGTTTIRLLTSGNKCRNPGGRLDGPWCYTYKNGTNCHKRFCDVCNIKSPVDVIKNCVKMIKDDPSFCQSSLQRHGCFKSCGFSQISADRATCSTPEIPPDGILVERARATYAEGERVKVNCSSGGFYIQNDMICTKDGWTPLTYACDECPPGWLKHGERCISPFPTQLSASEAESACRSFGVSGTLFQVKDEADQRMLFDFIVKRLGGDYLSNILLSGNRDPESGQWTFTNSGVAMTYFNWSFKYTDQIHDADKPCLAFIGGRFNDQSGWLPTSCEANTYRYMCQVNSENMDQGHGRRLSGSNKNKQNRNFRRIAAVRKGKHRATGGAKSELRDCPRGWYTHGDRCFGFILKIATASQAESTCQKIDKSGTLFQIRSEADQQMLRDLRGYLRGVKRSTMWVSGTRNPHEQDWKFTSTNTPMAYFNWTSRSGEGLPSDSHHGKTRQCVVLTAEWKTDGGGWVPTACNDPVHRALCQIDRSVDKRGTVTRDVSCQDKLGRDVCQEALTVYPTFCQTDRLELIAEQSCRESCGHCGTKLIARSRAFKTDRSVTSLNTPVSTATIQCEEPQSDTYSRTSPSSSIAPGEVMTFTCNPGYYYVSGNLTRACSISGQLLGQLPKCQSQPTAVDWNLNSIRKRLEAFPPNRAVLLDHDGYRLPAAGRITKWYYYCKKTGFFQALIYRRIDGGLTFVGSNYLACMESWPWSANIPDGQQISVLKDDIVGIFTTYRNTLWVDVCNGRPNQILPALFMEANSLQEVRAGEFSGNFCVVPSIGVHIEPDI